MNVLDFVNKKEPGFKIQEVEFCGIPSFLICAEGFDAKWSSENKIYRSSVWSKQGELLSAGLKKFVNLGELPDIFPPPKNLNYATIVEKLDGSCLICDWVNDKFSMKTRGTYSYKQLENWQDFEFVAEKYNLEKIAKIYRGYTLLFEIVSPNQRIVLDYGNEADAYLIGIINKRDYSLLSQAYLDFTAEIYGLKRPKKYEFTDLDELVKYIKAAENIEGVCIYTDGDQVIFKLKSEFYLAAHRMKSELGSINRVVEFYAQCGLITKNDFKTILENTFDFEVLNRAKNDIEKVYVALEKARLLFVSICGAITGLKIKDIDRKKQAQYIINTFPDVKDIAFLLLDGKQLNSKNIEKLIRKYL